jgi:hypothetical protein
MCEAWTKGLSDGSSVELEPRPNYQQLPFLTFLVSEGEIAASTLEIVGDCAFDLVKVDG